MKLYIYDIVNERYLPIDTNRVVLKSEDGSTAMHIELDTEEGQLRLQSSNTFEFRGQLRTEQLSVSPCASNCIIVRNTEYK